MLLRANDAPPSAVETAEQISARAWLKRLSHYRQPQVARSVGEIVLTVLPFAALWTLAWLALPFGWLLSLLISVPAAGFLVRLFLIQHDCGHGAFFVQQTTNDWVGRALSVLTMTPYDDWRRSHAMHHASSGNLDRRGFGDIDTLTIREYRARSPLGQLGYRLYRHPMVMFGIGPAYVFLLRNRVPSVPTRHGHQPWISVMLTNVAIASAAAVMIALVGLEAFLKVHIPIVLMAATIGVWLFYVQHQFEDTFWEHDKAWDHPDAALYGSSHYDLPWGLRWITANIGIHHVHHLSSKIPFYRLPQVMADHPALAQIRRLTLAESFACVKLRLWDEDGKRLVSFAEAEKVVLQPQVTPDSRPSRRHS